MKSNTNTFLFLVIAFNLIFSSCGRLKGEGESEVEIGSITSFDALDIDIPCKVYISYAEDAFIQIEAQENILENIYACKESNTLKLEETQRPFDYNDIIVTIGMPEFKSITLQNDVDVEIESKFSSSERLIIGVAGKAEIIFNDSISCYDFRCENSGELTLVANYISCSNDLYVTSSGRSNITISGKSDYASITADNYLEFYGLGLETKNTDITVSGIASPLQVNVSENLNVNVSGGANIAYCGNPINIDTSKSTGDIVIDSVEIIGI